MSQPAKLLLYLETHGSITQLSAFTDLGICRLSERIRELERLGFSINHEMVSVPSRDGMARVCRYSLQTEKYAHG